MRRFWRPWHDEVVSLAADPKNPWSVPVLVAQIPATGLHSDLEANAAQRAALAGVAGLRDVTTATASFDLSHAGGGKIQVLGHVSARIGQVCVVTLDEIENEISEPVDLMFVPEADIGRLSDLADEEGEESSELPDPPEPIVGGVIDLGRVATDALFLGIDPYPRKPGVAFEAPAAPRDPADHPFAALEALKGDAAVRKKPKKG